MATLEKELGVTQDVPAVRLYQKYTDGAAHVVLDPPWTYTEVDLATNADVVVHTGACVVGKFWVSTVMSAHAAYFLDGAASIYEVPASSLAGAIFTNLENVRFATSLIINSNDSATGKLMILWKAA